MNVTFTDRRAITLKSIQLGQIAVGVQPNNAECVFVKIKIKTSGGVPPAGDVTHSAPLGLRSFLLCPPLRVFSMGLAAKRLSVLEAL